MAHLDRDGMTDSPTAGTEIRTDLDNAFYWQAAAEGRLVAQRCAACEQLWHPPAPSCPHCQHLHWTIADLPHVGTLHSVAKVHSPGSPIQGTDYLVCLVDVADPADPQRHGIRVAANLRDCELADAHLDSPVELHFETLADGQLPQYRLAR